MGPPHWVTSAVLRASFVEIGIGSLPYEGIPRKKQMRRSYRNLRECDYGLQEGRTPGIMTSPNGEKRDKKGRP